MSQGGKYKERCKDNEECGMMTRMRMRSQEPGALHPGLCGTRTSQEMRGAKGQGGDLFDKDHLRVGQCDGAKIDTDDDWFSNYRCQNVRRWIDCWKRRYRDRRVESQRQAERETDVKRVSVLGWLYVRMSCVSCHALLSDRSLSMIR